MSLSTDGLPSKAELERVIPPKELLSQKPVVVIECLQQIPCDPCALSCPSGAILPFADINELPKVDYTKCTGCGLCIASCPGLAIFVVDSNYSEKEALVKLPYELLPLPKKGELVSGLDREGNRVAQVKVSRVQSTKNKTSIISILVPKELALLIRNIKVEEHQNG